MFLINSTVYVKYVYMLIWDSFNVIPLLFVSWMRTYRLVRCISSPYKTYVVNLEDVPGFRFSINNCNTIYSSRLVVSLTHVPSYEISSPSCVIMLLMRCLLRLVLPSIHYTVNSVCFVQVVLLCCWRDACWGSCFRLFILLSIVYVSSKLCDYVVDAMLVEARASVYLLYCQ